MDETETKAGLHLIDYKSSREVKLPKPEAIDLQIGLYYLGLENRYQGSLKRMTLLYLRSGEEVSFEATLEHKQQVKATITELASKLRQDEDWSPAPGDHCQQCVYVRYCGAVQKLPEPLPPPTKQLCQRQLVLSF